VFCFAAPEDAHAFCERFGGNGWLLLDRTFCWLLGPIMRLAAWPAGKKGRNGNVKEWRRPLENAFSAHKHAAR